MVKKDHPRALSPERGEEGHPIPDFDKTIPST
jgi:hypothetical protein